MEPTKKDSVVSTIKKLLDLADSGSNGTEAEVLVAMNKAKTLMAKYDLSIGDVQSDTEEPIVQSDDDDKDSLMQGKYSAWEKLLIDAVSKLTNTQVIYKSYSYNRQSRAVFIGQKTDVAMALPLYMALKRTVKAMGTTHLKQEQSYMIQLLGRKMPTGRARRSKLSYLIGLCVKLRHRAELLSQQNDGLNSEEQGKYNALVVTKNKLVTNYMADTFKKVSNGTPSSATLDQNSYNKGTRDGENVNLGTSKMLH